MELFETDPHEYLRRVGDPMEDFVDPKMSAANLLESVAKYRKKDNLDALLGFLTEALNEYAAAPPAARDARKKDGALVCLCTLSDHLKKSKRYKAQLEPLLVAHVLPDFASPVGFLRARAASVALHFSDIPFANPAHVAQLLACMMAALRDPCLPVQARTRTLCSPTYSSSPCISQCPSRLTRPLVQFCRTL